MGRAQTRRQPEEESLAVGGQAIMEGVMMRNGAVIAAAVRTPKGTITTRIEHHEPWPKRSRIAGLPIIRGAVSFVEILIIGTKILLWSASEATGEEEERLSGWELALTLGFAIILSLALFKVLPLILATTYQRQAASGNLIFTIIEGAAKILILIGYLFLIGRTKDAKRLFSYHGAEHKTIACYEKRRPLTAKNVLAQTRFHPRCGTSFILFVFLVSILFYLFIPLSLPFWEKLGLRLLLLPVIAGVSYEIIKFGARKEKNIIMRAIIAPGLALQRLTTREPDKSQVEVAIASLKAALKNPSRAPRKGAHRTPRG